ncbi:thioredoxin domain-containing protein, partial [Candidatus Gracilibacteria bacterium]|nr:thioredoxin domain-containing protein [Candidatus Gracilibacteria bacterium]
VLKKYGNDVSKAYNHYIVHDGKHFEILECMAEQKGEKGFFSLIENSFKNSIHEEAPLIAEAVKLGADKAKLEKCVSDGIYRKKVEDQTSRGLKSFNITSTPSSVFINAETGEYRILRGYSEDNSSSPFMDSIEIVK